MPQPPVPESGNAHRKFVQSLTPEEAMLITLRDELYGGEWARMVRDLYARRDGKPYVFKLVNLINEDIARIERLRSYEQTHAVNLSDYVEA